MPKRRVLEARASSGNVFADLGLADAGEHLIKAGLVVRIDRIVQEQKLTQAAAARLMGIDQPKVSAMAGGSVPWLFGGAPHALPRRASRGLATALMKPNSPGQLSLPGPFANSTLRALNASGDALGTMASQNLIHLVFQVKFQLFNSVFLDLVLRGDMWFGLDLV